MANVLTDLAADIYKAADVVGRELAGIIPSTTLNTDSTRRVAQGDTVRSHFTRTATVGTVTPAMTIPEGTDQTVDNKTMSLDTTASVKIPWTGEDMKHVRNGSGFETVYGDQIAQAMRAIVNQIETAAGLALKNGAGNAYGTSGTTPFGSNFNELAEVRRLLVDRGCPDDQRITLAINTAAGVKLRNLAQLQKANEAGGDDLLRRGTLLDLQGIKIKESAGIATHTAGTGASYDVDLLAGYAAGDKTIHVDTGTGTFVQGDIITFSAGNAGKKAVIGTGFAGDGDGDIVLNSGLSAAVADGEDVAILAAYTANVAFHQSAIEIGVRALEKPFGGDAAVDEMVVQDPLTGLVFVISAYTGYNKAMFDVSCLYGIKVWKEDFVCTLQG